MKSKLRILSMAAAFLVSLVSFALADTPQVGATARADIAVPDAQQPGARFRQMREKKMAARAALLGLTDAQQSQIKTIITTVRQANAPLIQKLAGDRKQLRALSNSVPFDEAAVRALIVRDESVRTDLAVSRIKVRNQIKAILTPEQQAKAQELRLFESNRQHGWGNGRF